MLRSILFSIFNKHQEHDANAASYSAIDSEVSDSFGGILRRNITNWIFSELDPKSTSHPVRNLLVVSVSTLVNTLIFFTFLFLWISNREVHLRKKRRGHDNHKSAVASVDEHEEESSSLSEFEAESLEKYDDDDEHDGETNNPKKAEKDKQTYQNNKNSSAYNLNLDASALASLKHPRHSLRMVSEYEETEKDDNENDDDGVAITTSSRSTKINIDSEKDKDAHNNSKNSGKSISDNNRERKKQMRLDLLDIVSKIKVFSYLSNEAFLECMEYMEYVNLSKHGMCLSEGTLVVDPSKNSDKHGPGDESENFTLDDGSLYAVVSGGVSCSCGLPMENTQYKREESNIYDTNDTNDDNYCNEQEIIRFAAGPGDVVSSLLSMLLGLVSQYEIRVAVEQQQPKDDAKNRTFQTSAEKVGNKSFGIKTNAPTAARSASFQPGNKGKNITIISTCESTTLLRIPPKCFLAILDKFPHDVNQISQTIVARMQRVTMQTLVKNLGLEDEILQNDFNASRNERNHGKNQHSSSTSDNESEESSNEQIKLNQKHAAKKHVVESACYDKLCSLRADFGKHRIAKSLDRAVDSFDSSAKNGPSEEKPEKGNNIQTRNIPQLATTIAHGWWNSIPLVKERAASIAASQLGVASFCLSKNVRSSNDTGGRVVDDTTKHLIESSTIITLPPGEMLIQSGGLCDSIYLLLDGELDAGMTSSNTRNEQQNIRHVSLSGIHNEVNTTPRPYNRRNSKMREQSSAASISPSLPSNFRKLFRYHPGKLIGRLASFTGDASIMTVQNTMISNALLLKIPNSTYHQLLAKHPSVLINCLRYILNDLISPVVHLLDWNLEWVHVRAGEMIARNGDPSDSLFVVLNGRIRAANVVSNKRNKKHSYSNHNNPALYENNDAEFNAHHEEFGRGSCIGEIDALTSTHWSRDMFAIRNSELAKMPLDVLSAIIFMFPKAGLHFAKVIALQVQQKTKSPYRYRSEGWQSSPRETASGSGEGTSSTILPRLNSLSNPSSSYGFKIATVAVVPLISSSTSTKDIEFSFCAALASSLQCMAPTELMTKDIARSHLGRKLFANRSNAMHEMKLTRLLGDMEEKKSFVLYQADGYYSWWTRLCIEQADIVLLMVESDKVPEKKKIEQCLKWAYESLHVQIELVVLQSQSDQLADDDDNIDDEDDVVLVSDHLNNWSEERRWIKGHHLIRVPFQHKKNLYDIHRMTRRITGRSIGLVLGGGGARGLAHLGIIKALKDANVPIDMVGGTSQGAFIGALYAQHPDHYDEFKHKARLMADSMNNVREKVLDLTLPLTSFFNGKRFNRGIRRCIGATTRIQDLVLNFFCISTDVRKNVMVVHTKGICWKYVRASMSLQGYLPPISENGSLLMDGGYTNVLPADVMLQQMGARTVIAVDVSAEQERDYDEYGTSLSGWWLLWNSWNPFVKTVKVPSMGDLSDRLAWVCSEQHKNRLIKEIDLYLRPPTNNYGTLEYDKFDEIVKIGEDYAKPIVDEWVKQNPWLTSTQFESKTTSSASS